MYISKEGLAEKLQLQRDLLKGCKNIIVNSDYLYTLCSFQVLKPAAF